MAEAVGPPVPLGVATPVPVAEALPDRGPGPRRKVLVFRAAGEWFGLPLDRVREVCPRAPITRVPRAPAQVLGVMNLRGRVVTLVDLALCLGLSGGGGAGLDVVLLDLGDPDLAVGLVADRIDQVVEVDPDAPAGVLRALEPGDQKGTSGPPGGERPPGASGKDAPDLVQIGGRAVTLLDAVRVLSQALPGIGSEETGERA